MCIFANEGGPKSKSSRKETPLKIQKYKEKHVSGKNLEKMFSAPTPSQQACPLPIAHFATYIFGSQPNPKSVDPESRYHFLIFSDTLLVIFLLTIYSLNTLSLSSSAIFWLYNGVYFSFIQVFHGLIIPWPLEGQKLTTLLHSFHLIVAVKWETKLTWYPDKFIKMP